MGRVGRWGRLCPPIGVNTAEPGNGPGSPGGLSLGLRWLQGQLLGALSDLPFLGEPRPQEARGRSRRVSGEHKTCLACPGRVTLTHPTQGSPYGAGRGGDGEGPAPEVCRLEHGTFQVREPRDRPPLLFIDTFAQCVLTALLLDWVWGGLHSQSSLTLWGTPRGPGSLHVLPWTLSLWGSSPQPRGRGDGRSPPSSTPGHLPGGT